MQKTVKREVACKFQLKDYQKRNDKSKVPRRKLHGTFTLSHNNTLYIKYTHEKMKRIAIQGEIGSFHDITAHHYFDGEQLQIICCSTFEEVFAHMKQDPTIIGIMAIENTIAGSLLHNYELLRESGMAVVGEHKTHISHCLCCLPGQKMEDLKEVHSHPVELAK